MYDFFCRTILRESLPRHTVGVEVEAASRWAGLLYNVLQQTIIYQRYKAYKAQPSQRNNIPQCQKLNAKKHDQSIGDEGIYQ